MKMKSTAALLTVFIAVLFSSNLSHAKKRAPTKAAPAVAAAKIENPDKVIVSAKSEVSEVTFEDTKILKSVTLMNEDKTETPLTLVSYGLRKKAVFGLVAVRVYVLQLLASHPDKLVKTEEGILASLKDAGPVQLHITFLRNLPGGKISGSFKEGLEANKIDVKNLSPEMTQLLKEISEIKEFKENESFTITVNWTTGHSTVYLTDSATQQMKTISGTDELGHELLSIWFGRPADSKLEELKKALLK
jgi:hypothetical protein